MIEARDGVGDNNYVKIIFKIISLMIILGIIVFMVCVFKLGIFDDKLVLTNYIKILGFMAPLIFVLLQILQVIIPIVPGGVSCMVGVLVFGPVLGFIYNYIGLIIGSIIVYYLSNKYGISLIKKIFKEEVIMKYLKYIDNNGFNKLFIMAIILPWFPDDLLCYIAGISNITFKSFVLIVLTCRPISLLFYSIFINVL